MEETNLNHTTQSNYDENESLVKKSFKVDPIIINNNSQHLNQILTKYDTIKSKKAVLSTLDILISVLFVSPCVVGYWRGTWLLMDCYEKYFPLWEGLILGTFVHLVFCIIQDPLIEIFNKKRKTTIGKILDFIIVRFFVYFFSFTNVMNWRTAWMLIDNYLNIKSSVEGYVIRESANIVIPLFGIALFLMVPLKAVGNGYAPPFAIYLDKKKDLFECPTRFKLKLISLLQLKMTNKACADFGLYKIKQNNENFYLLRYIIVIGAIIITSFIVLYLLLNLVNENLKSNSLENNSTDFLTSMSMEKLIGLPPKPFETKYHERVPSEFKFSTTTEKITTLHYPQIYNHNSKFPRNIQDILSHISQSNRPQYNQEIDKKHGILPIDKSLQPYKPNNPSEINLLATASVRFAPTNVDEFRQNFQSFPALGRLFHAQKHQHETTNRNEVYQHKNEPIKITLHVYPKNLLESKLISLSKLGAGNRLEAASNFLESHKMMVLNLHLYPNNPNGKKNINNSNKNFS